LQRTWQNYSGITALVWLGLLSSCASPVPDPYSEMASDGESRHELAQDLKQDPQYPAAERFHRFVDQSLSAEERKQLIDECRSHAQSDVFCFSVLREKHWRRVQKKRDQAPKIRSRDVTPIVPEIVEGKVKNFRSLRRAKIKPLLAGLRDFPVDKLMLLADRAHADKSCPTNIGIATAAILELYLPEKEVVQKIASLYEKGGRCARRKSKDQEHFYTRAALFYLLIKENALAEKILERIRPSDAYSGRSYYWLHRARLARGDAAGAREALTRLQSNYPFSFHALVTHAADSVDPLILQSDRADAVATRSKRKPIVNQIIEQAELLRKFGFLDSSGLVVAWALTKFRPPEPDVQLYVASLGLPDTQVRTATHLLLTRPKLRTASNFQLAYPRAYFSILNDQSSRVDPYLLLAIARKESTLNPKAVSIANAQGLLQLNPDTAARFSSENPLDLFNPRINAEISAKYIAELNSMMKGQLPLIIAAYNAGEQPVITWANRYPTDDLLLFIDLIPYRETRDYVGYVLANYYWYRRLYENNAAQPLLSLTNNQLARVDPPRGMRSVQSLVNDALRTSEMWPEEDDSNQSAAPAEPAGTILQMPLLDEWRRPE
jgi:soluble lytic murein transglycosylase